MKQVAAAIALNRGKVLVARRAPGENLAGYWEFPGGKLEDGESPHVCIIRELQEELNLAAEAGEILAESVYEYPGGSINLIGVSVKLLSDEIQLSVHDQIDWVAPSALLSINLAPADIAIAEELVRRYG
ncbi:(deoxy)nucleoside triphosphate pyrophosphohydrolase [Caenibius sp. WL]|uniref:(deoxy)nucleoside triphosphate pyrophosphohydrolase n=1 Tax=Caenibius sp. WL TaxID=2872646 RepID=UPI001C9996F3|nr:(deoxy)nucleoside triphosphate pyrophosphohydrolase [Caenibius sp. WL]QZP07696.1 (deoxy)nucleoside triphosphate pyrophosphohydrolase [Caenibius sp. WL]